MLSEKDRILRALAEYVLDNEDRKDYTVGKHSDMFKIAYRGLLLIENDELPSSED